MSEALVIEVEMAIPGARRARKLGKRPPTYGVGRVCAEADCITRLSRYNREDVCYRHQPLRYPRVRGVVTE